LNPWVAERPDSVENPGFDVTRYIVPFWQKCERMLRYARERDMVVSVIFYLDGADAGIEPFGRAKTGCDEEQRYYRYGVARLAAFSNVMWDVTNEYQLFRSEPWTEKMGTLIKTCDPYQHLTSVHGHGHIGTCFTSLKWWKMEPRDDLVSQGTYCLAEPGQQYLVYMPEGGKATVKLAEGKYQAQWFNPRNGQWTPIGVVSGPAWTSPLSPDGGDWAIVVRREE
jgi:hypothetical protein